jgi:PBS lyase HEAT-like repeat
MSGGSGQDGPEGAAGAVRALLRGVATLRTYPLHNAVSQWALEELEEKLAPVLPLELAVEPTHFRWREASLSSRERESGLVADLYRDGIRALQVREGMERDEMARMVAALAAPFDPEDLSEDYVTRLWEADLPHLGVVALDPYLDLEIPEDVLEGRARPSGETEDVALVPAEIDVAPAPEEAFRITAEDAHRMAEEVGRTGSAPPWDTFVDALFEALETPAGRRREVDLAIAAEACLAQLLAEGQVRAARRLIHALRTKVPEASKPAFGDLERRMLRADRLEALNARVDAGAPPPEEIAGLFRDLGPDAVEPALAFLLTASSERVRRFHGELLLAFGAAAVGPALEAFARAEGESKRTLVRVLGRMPDGRAVASLLAGLDDAELATRREILRALSRRSLPAPPTRLLDVALADEDSACRVFALRCVARAQSGADPSRLLERAQARAFAEVGDEERDLLFHCLGASGSDDVVPFLEKQLRPSWIFGRPSLRQQGRAARALRALGSPAARDVLERHAQEPAAPGDGRAEP